MLSSGRECGAEENEFYFLAFICLALIQLSMRIKIRMSQWQFVGATCQTIAGGGEIFRPNLLSRNLLAATSWVTRTPLAACNDKNSLVKSVLCGGRRQLTNENYLLAHLIPLSVLQFTHDEEKVNKSFPSAGESFILILPFLFHSLSLSLPFFIYFVPLCVAFEHLRRIPNAPDT